MELTADGERERRKRSEVGPRHDIVPDGTVGLLQVDGNTQTRRAQGTFCAEAFDGLDEAPRGHCTELDLARLEDAVASDDAPAVVVLLAGGEGELAVGESVSYGAPREGRL